MEEIIRLSVMDAEGLIAEGEEVHTFRGCRGMMIGADWDRKDLIREMKKWESTLQITGGGAKAIKHGIAFIDETGPLFIETDEDKLNAFETSALKRLETQKK